MLGEFLLQHRLISAEQLAECLYISADSGLSLEEAILSRNYIPAFKLYEAIAKHLHLGFADLRLKPCDKSMLSSQMREKYIDIGAIPWQQDGDLTIIATNSISEEVKSWARQNYGENYLFVITTPFDISYSVNTLFAAENDLDARESLWQVNPLCSAREPIKKRSLIYSLAILALFLVSIVYFPVEALAGAFIVTAVFYVSTMLFKAILLAIGYFASKNSEKNCPAIQLKNSELPIYTILIPLYREEKTLSKLVNAIKALDYPKSKLDVKLIVEEDDLLTINAIKELGCERIFELITVPYSLPRTKPKACNYALRFARGEYITIYDAEDIPEEGQLKKVLHKFYNSSPDLACVQARLNYFNREENLLTRMFAIEYSTLFDFMMFGLEKINIPIPLGGTSNHFRTATLRQIYAWDPYNVTEDADLGIRIAQNGWKCSVLWSLTQEEAPISLWAWIKQRTRWIKGHMQTYLVHMRKPRLLYKKLGFTGFMGMQFFLGAPTVIFLASPFMWLVWGLFMCGIIELDTNMPTWFTRLVDLSLIMFYVGIILQIAFAVSTILRNKWPNMLAYSLVFPFYWILHSIASFRALWQLITRPHYWEKTTHGVSRFTSG